MSRSRVPLLSKSTLWYMAIAGSVVLLGILAGLVVPLLK